jgi:uncharacterized Fe-S cluster-containing radical SAM superfamily protein
MSPKLDEIRLVRGLHDTTIAALNQVRSSVCPPPAVPWIGRIIRRAEKWGIISYDFSRDEFSATIRSSEPTCPSLPLGVGWIIIGACNKACIHCYGNAEQLPKRPLAKEECFAIVDRLAEAKVMRVTISGGEPMLRGDWPEVVSRLSSYGISVIMGTNGSLITLENVDNLAPCTRVEISVDAPTKELNNRIRPSRGDAGDSWWEAFRGISIALGAGIPVRVLTAINVLNQDKLVEIGGLLNELSVPEWNLSWTIPAGRAFHVYDRLRPDEVIVQDQVSRARSMYPRINIGYSNRSRSNRFYCLILPNGSLATEDLKTGQKVPFGSLIKEQLSAFWDEAHFNTEQHFEKWVGNRIVRTL